MNQPTPEKECGQCEKLFRPGTPRDWYCPECEEAHELERRNREQRERERKTAENIVHIRQAIHAKTPPRFRQTNIEHPGFNLAAWQKLARWIPTDEQPWLGLIGETGTCKTRMAYLLAAAELERVTCEHRPRFAFVTSYEVGEAVMRQYSNDSDDKREARDFLDHLRTAKLVLIDDMGKGRATPAVAAEWFAMIDHRHAHALCTIWTANSLPETNVAGMSDDMAGPFAARLNDCSRIIKLS